MEKGKFYLIACPWDWTVVGSFVRLVPAIGKIELNNMIYFTRTGATFDKLCHDGLVLSGDNKSFYHSCGDGIQVPDGGLIFPWHAETPWRTK